MSYSSNDDDSQQRFALGFVFALLALIVSIVIGTVVVQRGIHRTGAAPQAASAKAASAAAATTTAATPAASAAAVAGDSASFVAENGVVTFYFASGKADVAAGAEAALRELIANAQAQGKTAHISGFHDTTGNAEHNAELAKKRAGAVRDALLALGLAENQAELKKPEQAQVDGNNALARRVEVRLQP